MLRKPIPSSAWRHINKMPLSVLPSLGLNQVPESNMERCQALGMHACWGKQGKPILLYLEQSVSSSFFCIFPFDFPWCSPSASSFFWVHTYFHSEPGYRLIPLSLLILPTFPRQTLSQEKTERLGGQYPAQEPTRC